MKTAVSIPDEVFEQADQLARRRNVSRSELYATALRAMLADDASITDQLDHVHAGDAGDDPDQSFTAAAARRALARSDW